MLFICNRHRSRIPILQPVIMPKRYVTENNTQHCHTLNYKADYHRPHSVVKLAKNGQTFKTKASTLLDQVQKKIVVWQSLMTTDYSTVFQIDHLLFFPIIIAPCWCRSIIHLHFLCSRWANSHSHDIHSVSNVPIVQRTLCMMGLHPFTL